MNSFALIVLRGLHQILSLNTQAKETSLSIPFHSIDIIHCRSLNVKWHGVAGWESDKTGIESGSQSRLREEEDSGLLVPPRHIERCNIFQFLMAHGVQHHYWSTSSQRLVPGQALLPPLDKVSLIM